MIMESLITQIDSKSKRIKLLNFFTLRYLSRNHYILKCPWLVITYAIYSKGNLNQI
jgi:hypothetical protein